MWRRGSVTVVCRGRLREGVANEGGGATGVSTQPPRERERESEREGERERERGAYMNVRE